jgi:hypothetical protein
LARERGTRQIEGIGEIAVHTALFGGILIVMTANLNTVATLATDSLMLTLAIASAALVVLFFGVQLGRLLMRYQLHRLGGVLNTVTGEVMTQSPDE